MTYRRNVNYGTTSWRDRAPRKHSLSGTVFGDDEVQMPAMDVSDPARDLKVSAGCTPLEIVASPGTTPYNTCAQKVAGYNQTSGGSGWGATLSNLFAGAAAKPAPSSSSGAGSVVGQILGGLFAPRPAVYVPPPQTGMSTATKVALLGGGAVLLFALMKRD